MKLQMPLPTQLLVTKVHILGIAGLLIAGLVCSQPSDRKHEHSTASEFRKLMNTVADGWNSGDARKAADCYTEDAIYTEPPDKQVYVGREDLYKFFGGGNRPEPPMRMQWHNRAFDEETQVGFGEYTFQMNNRYHGIVIVKLRGGKISNWREYQYKSGLTWSEFSHLNPF
jgi:ketosteroid isomerase-like protein